MDIKLLRESFESVKSIGLPAIEHFYDVLLTDYPELEPNFHSVNMAKQRENLFGFLAYVIDHLEDPKRLIAKTQVLGVRHMRYNAKDGDYAKVGSALLKTLAHYFGPAWTPELETAWIEAYTFISSTMMDAAHKVQVAA